MTPSASADSYKHHRYPGEIISHAVWLYFRFPLSHRDVEERLCVRGVIVAYEAIRQWCRKFGPACAHALRRRPGEKWHLEIVCAQLTNTGSLATGSYRDGIPDFPSAMGDQPPLAQQFHQGALLRHCGFGSTALAPLAKGFDGRYHTSQCAVPIALDLQLLCLGCSGLLFLY